MLVYQRVSVKWNVVETCWNHQPAHSQLPFQGSPVLLFAVENEGNWAKFKSRFMIELSEFLIWVIDSALKSLSVFLCFAQLLSTLGQLISCENTG